MPVIARIAASVSGAWSRATVWCGLGSDRKIAGVCAGFAEYFDLDVTLVRLVWLIVAVMTGVGLLSYPIAWVVMPEEPLRLEAPAGHAATSLSLRLLRMRGASSSSLVRAVRVT